MHGSGSSHSWSWPWKPRMCVLFYCYVLCSTVQLCSRHCDRPTSRQRSSSGNCGPMVCVANQGHDNRSHEGVFFSIVMFCVQSCSRPTSRQRSSSGNCELMGAVVAPTRSSRRSIFQGFEVAGGFGQGLNHAQWHGSGHLFLMRRSSATGVTI